MKGWIRELIKIVIIKVKSPNDIETAQNGITSQNESGTTLTVMKLLKSIGFRFLLCK